jgi:hemerythrin-like domain-containing protein
MQQEDAILFRLAEDMLDDEVKDTLLDFLAGKNAEAQEITQRYEQLANELEKAWAV